MIFIPGDFKNIHYYLKNQRFLNVFEVFIIMRRTNVFLKWLRNKHSLFEWSTGTLVGLAMKFFLVFLLACAVSFIMWLL